MSSLPPRDHRRLPLTANQHNILRYIARVWEIQGRPPSLRTVAWRFGLTHKTVQEHLEAAYRKGWLKTPTPAGLRCLHIPPLP